MALYRPNANMLRNHALQFATIAHGNQVRKGNEHIPYIFHPVDVANEVIYFSGLPVPELEVASVIALLHDTVEDTLVTLQDVRDQFGDAVADGVGALTKVDLPESNKHSKLAELEENLERLKTAPAYVQAVKLADRISNLKSFPAMWGREKVSNYLDESALIARALAAASEGLHARLLSRIANMRATLSLLPKEK
ncbi:MAG: bifunctional (p)ppGpp synthetase/guanosine-3',5'-bis(diphosphate) 3'-pyrophosphohydrolase [Candidatus Pacebacteria bacterium]|nr:bifunctional (p)ppGpp synthetase/guanosine-3',5'-bis(diphosphate) 3'-pyrophosphohydrolase [Candidatus Paceibacterota bacterium]